MKIALIKPRYIKNSFHADHSSQWSYFSSLVVVSSLFPDSDEMIYFDEDYEPIDFQIKPDYVFITSLTYASARAYEIAGIYKKANVPVIMGGIHASLMVNEALQYVDTVVIGEAEAIFDELYSDMQSKQIKRIYKSSTFIAPEQIAGLDKRLIQKKSYLKDKTVTQYVRGCPYSCTFCTVTNFFGNKFRFRSTSNVIEEIKYQKSFRSSMIVSFLDDNIFSNRKKAKELMTEIKPLRIKWWSQGTLNSADDEELLQLMKDSGCMMIFVGIEDISQAGLKEVNKKCNDLNKYREQIEKLHSKDIMVMAGFIFGLETHDETIFEEVINFIQDTKIELPFFSILTPYPGTELYNNLLKEGRILTNDWSLYNQHNVVFQPKKLTPKTLQEGFNYVIKESYSKTKINQRIEGLSPKIKMIMKQFLR
jgi:radical SAM superfamily enzyme YgiQ (UPF0313 family)